MSRALVLGGGGPVGIGWESGLVGGLADAGVDLRAADLVVGTSAGSVVGALLRLDAGIEGTLELLGGSEGAAMPAGGMETFFATLVQAAQEATSPEDARRRLGRLALEADTGSEEDYLARFATVADAAWPPGFACTAVDTETGEPVLWDRDAGVALQRAVASSCAVPGIFPPVTISGRRWMDGGMRTSLNADLAEGHDTVVAVSCFALELPEGMSNPLTDRLNAEIMAELDQLRSSGSTVEVVVPGAEMLEISGWGLNLMDFGRAGDAFAAGVRQAAAEADRLREAWAS